MSSDEDDMLNYTPLQRSQVSTRKANRDLKPSKLSLSYTRSQSANKKTEINKKSTKSYSSKVGNRKTSKNTPTKSRADKPEENCSESELARWRFLFQSEVDKTHLKPQPLRQKSDAEGTSQKKDAHVSSSQQKRKSASGEIVSQNAIKKQDDGICSNCKFPWNTLQERSHHSFRCEDKKLSDLPRCSMGDRCRETEEKHFWKFNHKDQLIKTPKNPPWISTRNKTWKDTVKTDTNTSTNYTGCNGVAGPSSSKKTSVTAESYESPDVIMLSDFEGVHSDDHDGSEFEEGVHSDDHDSIKFKLEQRGNQTPTNKDLDLHDDDQSTLYFGEHNKSAELLSEANRREGNQKSRVTCSLRDDSSGSETNLNDEADDDEAGVLEDSERDMLVADVVDEAVSQFAMPALEKVMRWKRNMETHAGTSTQESSQRPSPMKTLRKASPAPCIHIHFHEASPAQTPSKESGQTSIFAYFKPKPKEGTCHSGGNKTSSVENTVAALQGLMGRMQKRKLVSLPSISQSSSEGTHTRAWITPSGQVHSHRPNSA